MTREVIIYGAASVSVLVGLIGLRWGLRSLAKRKAKKSGPPAAPPPPEPEKPYTWKDYERDVRDDTVSISDILDRCHGVIPEKPKAAPPMVAAAPEEKTGVSDLSKNKQAWFDDLARHLPPVKIVPPPPVTLSVQAFLVPCVCQRELSLGKTFDLRLFSGRRPYRCERCKDTGVIAITKG